MFVVHRESENKPNMEFRMHESGLHYYDPRDEEELAFVNTVSENKEGFTKRQIKGAEVARTLYATLSYPSMKDFKWVIRSNQIKDCPVTVQDVDVALKIWGKNIAALKGKTTWKQTKSSGKGLCESSYGVVETPQGGVPDSRYLFCEQDSIFLDAEPQDMLYGGQPPREQNCSANLQGLQGDLPVLSPTWLSHHDGACGWRV